MQKCYDFFRIFFKVLIGILFISLLFQHAVPYYIEGTDSIYLTSGNNILIIALSIICFVLVVFLCSFKHEITKKELVIILGIAFGLRIVLAICFPLHSYYDMSYLMDHYASGIMDGSLTVFDKYEVITFYRYNFPIMLFNLACRMIGGSVGGYYVGYFVNAISLTLINYFIFEICNLVYNPKIAKYALIISLLFFPLYGYTPLIYNDVISALLYISSVYMFVKYIKLDDIKSLIISILLLSIGILFRSIGYIYVIAYVIVMILNKKIKNCVIIILIPILMNNMFYKGLELSGMYVPNSASCPVKHYIALGLSNGQDGNTPGYYVPLVDKYRPKEDGTLDEQHMNDEIKEYITIRIGEIKYQLPQHYFKKYLLQWSDGTFETMMFLNFVDNKNDSPITYHNESVIRDLIINNKVIYNSINYYCRAFWLMIIGIIFAGVIKKDDQHMVYNVTFKLLIMGVMAFYVIWEISPHYSFGVLPIFIILCAYYLEKLNLKWMSKGNKSI